jgi:Mg-chelatase subunit ChlD
MNKSIIPGSLGALARQNNTSIAETFLSCDVICIVDTSGSMAEQDSAGGRSRYDVACSELAQLQQNLPGKIGVISFSSTVQFCPNGVPVNLNGGTDLASALKFTKVADLAGMRFILISDGEPYDPDEALKIARTYINHIDVIYVGPEEGLAEREFLSRLAQASGGQAITADRAKELTAKIEQLLLHA